MRATFELIKTEKYTDEIDKLTFKNRVAFYKGDKLHREDGPAVIFNNGEEVWLFDGELHRCDDLPARTSQNGNYKEYYVHNIPHRLTGPALEYLLDPSKNRYIIEGQEYSEKEFKIISRKIKLKNLI